MALDENSARADHRGFLIGGGEAGAMIRAFDWTASPLGVPESWPQPLKTLVGVMLAAGQPMFVVWGPERILLYNNHYAEILASKHPWALGRDFLDVWSEIRADLIPIVEQAFGGEPVHFDDIQLVMERRGYPEETHFAFSYTPVRDEAGAVSGFFCPCIETTEQVLAGRRMIEERERQRRMLQQMPGFVALLSGPDHRYEYVNDAYPKIVGNREFLGRTVREVFPDAAGQGYYELLDNVYRTGEAFAARAMPIRLDGADGEQFIDLLFEPVRDDVGRVTGIFVGGYDVTERVRAERALRESEQQFRLMADAVPQIVWITDAEGKTEFFNKQWFNYIGSSDRPTNAEDVALRYLHPEDAAVTIATFEEARRNGTNYFVEHRIRSGTGDYRWFLVRGEPYRDPQTDEVVRWFGTSVDIDERRQAEIALRDSEARLKLALDAGRLAEVTFHLPDGVSHSSAFAELLGHPPGTRLALSELRAHYHPDDRDRVAAERAAILASTQTFYEVENRIVRPDGQTRWVYGRGSVERDEQGQAISVTAVYLDETDRKTAEAALRESEARLRAVIEAAPVGLVFADPSGRITGGNSRIEEIIGRSIVSSEGIERYRDDYVAFHADGRRVEGHEYPLAKVLQGEAERAELEVQVQLPDLALRWVRYIATPMRDDQGDLIGAVVASLDVDREKRFTESLAGEVEKAVSEREEALSQVHQMQKMETIGQLTGGVAHDFNNLLTPIIGSLDMLVRRGVGSERERRLIDGALQSAERAKTLVQRLLAFARRQPLQPVAVDLSKLVEGMLGLMESTLGPAIHVEVDVARDLPAATADANQLEMALLNLAVNARDAMPSGGELTIRATVECTEPGHRLGVAEGQYVRLCISDTGSGMDQATLQRAIEPFFSTKGVGQGTGLGLSMVHGLVAQLGGGMTITSAPDRGTSVELWLPISATAVEAPYGTVQSAPIANGLGTALLVDDEELVRMSTADMLSDLGYEVVEAGSAEDALRLIGDGLNPSLVVTDHLMPGMSGARLAGELKSFRPGLPVLIISGYAQAEELAPEIPRLTKPFRKSELAASLSALPAATKSEQRNNVSAAS